jgi:hypothetical protein
MDAELLALRRGAAAQAAALRRMFARREPHLDTRAAVRAVTAAVEGGEDDERERFDI